MADEVSRALTRLEKLFTPGVLITFIARFEGDEEADVFISIDDPAEVLALVARTMARDRGERPSFSGQTGA